MLEITDMRNRPTQAMIKKQFEQDLIQLGIKYGLKAEVKDIMQYSPSHIELSVRMTKEELVGIPFKDDIDWSSLCPKCGLGGAWREEFCNHK